jgi:hypothetical protein
MNLSVLCSHLRNWFCAGQHYGKYTIKDGELSLPFLAEGQYFRIIGSVFNDGVWKYPAALTDETFDGAIWAMAVPPDVIVLCEDITAWEGKYRDAAESPYQSESFGGYTYTKASGDGSSGSVSWQTAFRARLSPWRKL